MRAVYITPQHNPDNTDYAKDTMQRCPICGAKPFVSRDIVDGYYFGWSVGCPRFRINDGIHGYTFESPEEDKLTCFGLPSKEECDEWWNKRVERQAVNGKQE